LCLCGPSAAGLTLVPCCSYNQKPNSNSDSISALPYSHVISIPPQNQNEERSIIGGREDIQSSVERKALNFTSSSFSSFVPLPPPRRCACSSASSATARLRLLSFLRSPHRPKGGPRVCTNVIRDEFVEPAFLALQALELRSVSLVCSIYVVVGVVCTPQRKVIKRKFELRARPSLRYF